MAHFGNCDPETADQEYCIFHKPDKSEEEAVEFYRKFLERFKPRVEEIEVEDESGQKRRVKRFVFEKPVDARGFVFPEIPDVTIEYNDKEGNEWNQKFSFEYAMFEHIDISMTNFIEANFNNMKADRLIVRGAYIERGHFKDAKFGILVGRNAYFEWVDFRNSSFEEADFERAMFKTVDFSHSKFFEANFDEVQFGDADFNDTKFGGVSFIDTKFGYANFLGAHFDYADFTNAIFEETAIFKRAIFSIEALFSESKFNKEVHFSNAEFRGKQTSFARSTFRETAHFDSAEFGNAIFNFAVFEKGASFKNAEFHGNVHFEDVEFKKTVEFQSAKFERDAIFNGSTFEKRLIFVEKDISTEPKPKFRGKLEFSNCDFRQGVRFVTVPASNTENAVKEIERQLKELFDPNSPSYSYSLQEAARIQRLSFEKEGKRDEADQMFVIEMRARRKIRMREAIVSGRTWSKFKARLYNFLEWLLGDLFSNYGTGWARLLYMGLGIPLGIFPLVYVLSQYQYLGINFGFVLTLLIFSFLIGAFTSQSFDIEPRRESRKNLIIHSTGIFGILWTIFSLLTTLNPQGSICIPAANSMCKPIEMFSIPNDIFNILYYSMVTFTTLGYGDMHPTGWLKALSAIEALTGAVFMALIVAVIARKWMR